MRDLVLAIASDIASVPRPICSSPAAATCDSGARCAGEQLARARDVAVLQETQQLLADRLEVDPAARPRKNPRSTMTATDTTREPDEKPQHPFGTEQGEAQNSFG